MKINKFKKISSNKYKLFLDNKEITIYEDIIIKYNLLYKKDIDDKLMKQIEEDNYKFSIYDVAIRYIEVRMRSEKEMYEYLKNKEYNVKDIENTINKLKNNNLINDDLFSRSYINDKLNLTNNGLNKIKNDLLNLGIEESLVEKNISNVDVNINDRINNIIEKELKINSKYPIFKLKNKIINKCINLGYNYDDILLILDNIKINSKSDIKKEYDKLYNKYKNKYEDNKLKLFIKNKLYQKGYSIDEINNIYE